MQRMKTDSFPGQHRRRVRSLKTSHGLRWGRGVQGWTAGAKAQSRTGPREPRTREGAPRPSPLTKPSAGAMP